MVPIFVQSCHRVIRVGRDVVIRGRAIAPGHVRIRLKLLIHEISDRILVLLHICRRTGGTIRFQRIHHPLFGAVFGPGGVVGVGRVRLLPDLLGLRLQQQTQRRLRLAHHAGRLRHAARRDLLRDIRIAGPAQTLHRVGVGRDMLSGERGLRGIARA